MRIQSIVEKENTGEKSLKNHEQKVSTQKYRISGNRDILTSCEVGPDETLQVCGFRGEYNQIIFFSEIRKFHHRVSSFDRRIPYKETENKHVETWKTLKTLSGNSTSDTLTF